ncbi:MAG: lysophospholipid acyltransferase family protein [candidate division Zixibacteria bacterium]|nr:lysophospholipid acyltransferase family protein [candidate division Zixibacteria bacterium]
MALRPGKKIKNSSVYLLTISLIWLFNVLPRKASIAIGGALGKLAWRMLKRDRRRADENLLRVYGEKLTEVQREEICRSFFINSGRNLVDVLRFKRHFDEIKASVTVEGIEHFDAAYRRGKGMFGVTGHLGNFELLAAYVSSLGYKIAVIGREMYDRRLDALLVSNREAVGLVNIATTDSPKRIIEHLRKGGAIGVLIDIDSMRVRSAFVPFFGVPANTPIGQSVIAVKTGAALVPIACVRESENRYKVIVKPEILFDRTGDVEKDAFTATVLCTRALEEMIDRYRDQWIWIHTRWNTRPTK